MLNKHSLINLEDEQPDTNPMDSLSNLADVMLVLAVGIMLALIINWNVDISKVSGDASTQSVDTTDALEFSDEELEEMSGDDINDDDLTQLGRVYYDKKTGTYYIVGDESTESAEK